jgi:exonuclease SbcC
MITRLELTNFMSHKHTVIEPAAGLTVLVGPNNVGKSAVVAALQILCHNENSTYVLRHGEKECSVCVHTDDGHIIQWRRKNAPSYIIDGQVFDRLRSGGLPDELHQALRLPKVDADGDADFDVHFGMQKEPIFLLKNSAANAARFFASSSDAIRLMAIQRRHKEKLAKAKREKEQLEADSKRLNDELGLLEPVVQLDARLAAAEDAFNELAQREDWINHATRTEAALRGQNDAVSRCKAHATAFGGLNPPPQLAPIQPLERLIEAIENEQRKLTAAQSRAGALSALAPAPELAPTEPLSDLVIGIEHANARLGLAMTQSATLSPLSSPPQLADTASLEELVKRLAASLRDVKLANDLSAALARAPEPPVPIETTTASDFILRLQHAAHKVQADQTELETAESELTAAANELRARSGGARCPICGSDLDPDRVVKQAVAAGVGDHCHG